ncbi:MAG: putative toxin-antitoxin system toxin component, PIN family [Thermoleophilia bacterium]
MKVILDTNVLLSGLINPEGAPGRIVGRWRGGGLELVLSERQLEEIVEVFGYPKIARRLAWGVEEVERFVLLLRLKSEIVSLPSAPDAVPDAAPGVFQGLRDSADAHLLSALELSGAEVLVSGDHHLLELRGRLPILSPVEFAARL